MIWSESSASSNPSEPERVVRSEQPVIAERAVFTEQTDCEE